MVAAVGMSQVSSSGIKWSFCGTSLERKAAAASKATNVAFAVRAAGYDEELVKTAVCLD